MNAALLTREREFELARRWRNDEDEDALHELITSYTRLVIKIAGKFRNYGLPMSDLVQEGNIGLLQAAARFEPEREIRFSTYASWWIRSAMQDYVLRNWSIVRTGTTAAQKALFFNLRRMRAKHGREVDGWLDPEAKAKIAKELKVKSRDVTMMETRLSAGDQSLNVPIGEHGEDQWQDLLPDDAPTPEEVVVETREHQTRRGWLASAMAELSPREQTIINERRLREDSLTLEKLGKILGISKERVRQIEHKALHKLRVSITRRSTELPDATPPALGVVAKVA
jgi:RNA polymerase sigma-32 factor